MTVPPIDRVRANDVLDHASARPDALGGLVERFNQAMQAQPAGPPLPDAAGPPSALSAVVSKGEAAMQNLFDSSRAFVAQAPAMSLQEMTSRSMALTWEMANAQLQFTACTAIAQSSKNGLQTLMKNQ